MSENEMSNIVLKIGNRDLTEHSLEKLAILSDALESAKVDGTGSIHLKFKNDVIIDSPGNVAILNDGFNIQQAGKIFFCPYTNEHEMEEFKEIVRENFKAAKYKIISDAATGMDQELTPSEINEVIAGTIILEPKKFEDECDTNAFLKEIKDASTHTHPDPEHCNKECLDV